MQITGLALKTAVSSLVVAGALVSWFFDSFLEVHVLLTVASCPVVETCEAAAAAVWQSTPRAHPLRYTARRRCRHAQDLVAEGWPTVLLGAAAVPLSAQRGTVAAAAAVAGSARL